MFYVAQSVSEAAYMPPPVFDDALRGYAFAVLKRDNFRCRYEMFLTDPKVEPRKTKWSIELAIKLVDE